MALFALTVLGAQQPQPATGVFVAAPPATGTNPIAAARQPGANTSAPNAYWATDGVVGGIPSAGWSNCDNTACNALAPGGAGTVNATNIQNALSGATVGGVACSASSPCVVRIRSGSFSVGAFNHTYPGRVLRGQGAQNTRITLTSAQSGAGRGGSDQAAIHLMQGTTATWAFQSPAPSTTTWTANYTQGTSTNLTVGSSASFTAGSVGSGTLIFFDQLNDSIAGSYASIGYPGAGDLIMCENANANCSNQGTNGFARAGRTQIQAVTVTNKPDSTHIDVSPAISMPNWRSSQTPGIWWASATPLQLAGIEDIGFDVTGLAQGFQGIMIANAVNCWVKGVAIIHTGTVTSNVLSIHVYQSAHISVTTNFLYGPNATGSPFNVYAISDSLVSNNLYENNIIQHSITPMMPNDPSDSNVWSYNYIDDAFLFGSTFQYHSGPANMTLLEGNNVKTILADIIHGPHYINTQFRNHMDGTNHNQSATTDMANAIHSNNRFFNMLGNVMGFSSWTKYQECPSAPCTAITTNDPAVIWMLGWHGSGSSPANCCDLPDDINVYRTSFRWGNWDNVTSTSDTTVGDQTGVRWCGSATALNGNPNTGWTTRCGSVSEVPSTITNYSNSIPATETLPASLYLSAQPSWWATAYGTPGFPAIGPDVSCSGALCATNTSTYPTGGHAYKIPARLCFENVGNDATYPSSSPRVKAFDRATCYPGS